MKLFVKETNADKINKEIEKVEGRCSVRCIDYTDIEGAVEDIEKRLDIPQSHLKGIVAKVDPWAQKFPNAYKYAPYSTQFTVERFASGWAVTEIKRTYVLPPSRRYQLVLTDEAKTAIVNRCVSFS